MAIHRFEIEGQPDFELGIERKHPVTAIVETPDTETADGLVFIISGMGGEKDADYSAMQRRYLSTKYNLIAVSVDSHCNTCRLSRSTEFGTVGLEFDTDSIIAALGVFIAAGGKIDRPLNLHSDILSMLKEATSTQFKVKATLVPPGEQYQNFGVLSALDHIAVLNTLLDSDMKFDTSNIVCVGSSHGGYIAHMMHKFAPNSFNGIIEASAYTQTEPRFISGLGDEIVLNDGNLSYACSVVQRWQFSFPGEQTFFGPDRALIRDTAYEDQLMMTAASALRKCQFRMIHSEVDNISPPTFKKTQEALLTDLGFDASLDMVGDKDVDGKFIKFCGHGMGIPINLLFDKYYPTIKRQSGAIDRDLNTKLVFDGPKMTYKFAHRPNHIHVDAMCENRHLENSIAARMAS